MNVARRHPLAASLCLCAAAVTIWAALAPLRYASREQLFDIPDGAAARRQAGAPEQMLPTVVRLALGAKDVLLLKNSDRVAHSFGPVRLLPGEQFRLPFEQAADIEYACSAQPGGLTTVSVVALPDPGMERLRWRFDRLLQAIRYWPPGRGRWGVVDRAPASPTILSS